LRQLQTLPIILSTLLLITGCSTAARDAQESFAPPDESVVNTYWKLVTLDGKPVSTQENFREAHMVLHLDSLRLAGSTGCNTLNGSYRLESERIEFAQLATTKMACPPLQMEIEQAFLMTLRQVTAWSVDGATLVLSSDNNKTRAVFEAVHLY